MSNYSINANGPCISSQHGDAVDKTVENTGSFTCWLSETPGIATLGRELRPGATYQWPALLPLYIQCTPGTTDVTTVTVGENAGNLYTPSLLNNPSQLFQNSGALAASGIQPVGGIGNAWEHFIDGTIDYARTQITDCSNYNSVIVTINERGLGGTNYERREMFVVWYQKSNDGTYVVCYREQASYYVRAEDLFDEIATGNQLTMHLPARGTHFAIYIAATTYTGEPAAVNLVYCSAFGDNRIITDAIVKVCSPFWWYTENVIGTPLFLSDLAFSSSGSQGSMFLANGTTAVYSVSSISGPVLLNLKINATAALVQNTRVELQDRNGVNNNVIAGSQWTAGIVGVQESSQTVWLPRAPVRVMLSNNQTSGTTTFTVTVIPQNK